MAGQPVKPKRRTPTRTRTQTPIQTPVSATQRMTVRSGRGPTTAPKVAAPAPVVGKPKIPAPKVGRTPAVSNLPVKTPKAKKQTPFLEQDSTKKMLEYQRLKTAAEGARPNELPSMMLRKFERENRFK